MPFATGYTVPDYLGMAVAEETLAQLAGARNPVASLLARGLRLHHGPAAA